MLSYDHRFRRQPATMKVPDVPLAPVPLQHADQQIRVSGLKVHVQIRGDGEPLLLYSGVWGEVRQWENLLSHLHGFRTIAFDPPGIGRSQLARWPLTMPALARLGIGVLDKLGVGSAHVLGMSFGGALAQQTAVSHPERVRRLVLASTTFGGFAMPGDPVALWHFIDPRAFHPARLERVAGAMFGGRLRTEPGLVRSMHIHRPANPLAALSWMAPLFGWTSLPWLWAIRHPTLIVAGDDDPVTPLVNHQIMASLIPDARLHRVGGGGHMALFDSPAEIGPVITSFLRADHPARAGAGALPLAS